MEGFLSRWQFPQCAGAVDGTDISILAPAENHTDYFNWKGFHSVVMQAFVDYWYRFMDIYIRWPGSVQNAQVLTNSDLFAKCEKGTLLPDSRRMIMAAMYEPVYPLLPWLVKGYFDCGTMMQNNTILITVSAELVLLLRMHLGI